MKFHVVLCGVFEPYVRQLAQESSHEINIKVLDAGLHSRPNDLRLLVQAEIDSASKSGAYDAVILLYGLCGRGTANLVSRNIPLVIPRAHDCITLFLGSREAYLREFNKNPGTFYHTLGWIEKKINPKNREASELYLNYGKVGYEKHPDFRKLERQFGKENAEHVLAFMDRWRQHYTRAAYIDLGLEGEDSGAEFTKEIAETFDWQYEKIQGTSKLIRNVLNGDWNEESVFVLPPNSASISSGDDRVFISSALDSPEGYSVLSASEVIVESSKGETYNPAGIGLGIDAGGTYTDAVIYDIGERKLLAKAKALTTYHDLVEGIRNSLAQLPENMLRQVQVTSLSTTLATNAIVEGRGCKVGLIVLAPWDWFGDAISHVPSIRVPGATAITGEIIKPLDEDACMDAIKQLIHQDDCGALVVAGYATVRNPELANRVRELALEIADVPVICSHEVSRRLNAITGAQAAIANAKLLPVIQDLIDSVHKALEDFHVPGRLMVVKGDGTPVDESVARARPIETILSGPAASVSGARILTGLDDALVLDIGGTTTDCAVIRNGQVAIAEEGARIGERVMSVEVADICTVGLGGDSRIDFTRDRKIAIGPMRNIPMCCLATQYKSVNEFLANFNTGRYASTHDSSALNVLVRDGRLSITPSESETKLLELLEDGPLPALYASEAMELPSPALLPLRRLVGTGTIKISALTPTDLLHITGEFSKWNSEAAKMALNIFSIMYGAKPEDVLEMALKAVTRRLFEEVIRREVSLEDKKLREIPGAWTFLLDRAFSSNGDALGLHLEMKRPVVAIGAPADSLVPRIQEHMGVQVVVPNDADVANAIGAIGAEIVVREEMVIRTGEVSNYVLHGTDERIEFSELAKATDKAFEILRSRARQNAIRAGAIAPEITLSRHDKVGSASDGSKVFLERIVTAVATGGAFFVESCE